MASALISRSSSLGLSPGHGHRAVFLDKKLTLTVFFSTQVYKWVLAKLIKGKVKSAYEPSGPSGRSLTWVSVE